MSLTRVIVCALIVFGAITSYSAAAVINFDALDAQAAPVSGATLDAYLAVYGVTITNNTAGSAVGVQDDRWSYGGGVVGSPSVHNYLLQYGVNNGESFQLTFATTESSVSFTRVAELADSAWPEWSAQAFNASNVAVGSAVGESIQGGTRAAQTFTLTGSGIKSVLFTGNGFGFAAYASVPFDNLVLPNAVPEPASAAGAFVVTALLMNTRIAGRRRSR